MKWIFLLKERNLLMPRSRPGTSLLALNLHKSDINQVSLIYNIY